jgi:hypothetical protein
MFVVRAELAAQEVDLPVAAHLTFCEVFVFYSHTPTFDISPCSIAPVDSSPLLLQVRFSS